MHRKAPLAERLKAGDDYVANDLVFCTGEGQPLHPRIASNLFRKAVILHDMPRLSVNGLRKTWATLALQSGVHPKIVQEDPVRAGDHWHGPRRSRDHFCDQRAVVVSNHTSRYL